MKRRILFNLAVCAFGIFISAAARAETIELKFGHDGAPGSLFAASSEEFARRANAKLGNKAKVLVFGSSQLGDDTEVLQKVKVGTVDFAIPSTIMSSVVPAFGLFEMPYLVKDRQHMQRIEREIVWPTLAPLAEQQGYKILAVWENGFRQITNSKRPIVTPDDLKGMKLRVPKGKWRVRMFQAYGASPSAMGLSEVFVALQTGVMDGQENPFPQIYAMKFQEVQKYLSLTDHVYTPAYVVVSAKKWETLSPDVRQVLEQTAKETQAYVYETAARMDKELLEKFKATGMQVNVADRQAFVKASGPIYEEFAREVPGGKEMVDRALKLAGSK
jgi:tripartite ATP-independent transporter DctP family solute receptor